MSDHNLPPATPYTGPTGVMRDSVWLTNEDLPHDRDVIAKIETVNERHGVTFQGGRKMDRVFSLKFEGKERELRVNATHRKVLNALTGKATAGAWVGMRIYLFVEQGIRRPDGSVGPAVRIRAKRPPKDGAPAAATTAVDEYADIPQDREPGDEP